MIPKVHHDSIQFEIMRSSHYWVYSFIKRHSLDYMGAKIIKFDRVDALISKIVAERIDRVGVALQSYRFNDPRCPFNIDQSRWFFEKIVGRSFRKVISKKRMKLNMR